MKIGLVCPYNIFAGGGVQEVVIALQSELSKRGHTVKIITPLHRNHHSKRRSGTIFVGTSTDFKSLFHTTAQVSVTLDTDEIDSMLAREKFDILHFHEPWVPIMSRQLLVRSKAKNIATFHAKLPESVVSKTIERVITPYTKSVMKYLDELTAVSDAAAEYVRSLTTRDVHIVPNGIDLAKYQREKPQKTDAPPLILYVGRLEKRKGVKYLLTAFELFARSDTKTKLIIAGDGPERVKLEEYTRNHKLSNVSFVGHVSDTKKRQLLSQASLFCAPALYGESFGIVLLEAMAYGLVTVAGNNSGYSAVLKGKGALSVVNPKDTPEFARRLDLMLRDQAVRKIWQNWAHDYVQQFNYPTVVSEYEAIYKQTLERK